MAELPAGFVLDEPTSGGGSIPAGFVLDQPSFGSEAKAVAGNFGGTMADMASFIDNVNPMQLTGPKLWGLNPLAKYTPDSGELLRSGMEAVGLDPQAEAQTGPGKVASGVANALPMLVIPGVGVVSTLNMGLASGLTDAAGGDDTAQMIAGLAAGISPSVFQRTAAKGVDALKSVFSTAAKETAAKKAAQETIAKVANVEDILPKLQEFNAGQATVSAAEKAKTTYLPQYMRTAEVAKDPGILALEKAVSAEPMPNALISAQDAARAEARSKIFKSVASIDTTDAEAGRAIRQGLADNLGFTKEEVSKAADKAFAETSKESQIRTFPAKKAVSDALTRYKPGLTKLQANGGAPVTRAFQESVDSFRTLPAKVDLETLHNFRSTFGKYARAGGVGATSEEKFTARAATKLRQSIDNSINTAIEKGELPKRQAKAWRDMITKSYEQHATYEKGVVGNILKPGASEGAFKLPGSKVPNKALSTPEDAKAVIAALKKNIPGKKALQDALTTHIYERSTDQAGNFVSSKFATQVKVAERIGEDVLSAKQKLALYKIDADLFSQYKSIAAKGGSAKALAAKDGGTALDAIKKGMSDTATAATRNIFPGLNTVIRVVRSTVANPELQQKMLKDELTKFALSPEYAENLLKAANSPAGKGVIETFTSKLAQSLPLAATKMMPENDKRSEVLAAPTGEMPVEAPKSEQQKNDLLDAIRKVESNDGKYLKSKAGAEGPYQFMPKTAKAYGLKDPYDEKEARKAAHALITDEFKALGSIELALAAYNAGRPTVLEAIKKAGSVEWNEVKNYLPEETQNYIPKIEKQLGKLTKV